MWQQASYNLPLAASATIVASMAALCLAASRPTWHVALVPAIVGHGDLVVFLGVRNGQRLTSSQDVLDWGALYRHRHCARRLVALCLGLKRSARAANARDLAAHRTLIGVGYGVDRGFTGVLLD